MALNRGQLITLATYATGNRTDLATHMPTWFNWALRQIDRVCDIKGLEVRATAATVVDQKVYALPSDCKYIETLKLIDGTQSRTLAHMNAREFDRAYPYPEADSTDKPSIYVEYESTFELYKIPSEEWTLQARYWKWQDDIAADADLPEIGYCDDIIVKSLIVIIWSNLEELKKKRDAYDELMALLSAHRYVEKLHPDWTEKLKGYPETVGRPSEPWKDPFYKGD